MPKRMARSLGLMTDREWTTPVRLDPDDPLEKQLDQCSQHRPGPRSRERSGLPGGPIPAFLVPSNTSIEAALAAEALRVHLQGWPLCR
jgi:hypothetical protein